MAAAVSASLVGTTYPRAVQVVVSGLTSGQVYEIRGTWNGHVWPVRAGKGTSDGSQVVRSDLAAPINTPVVYEVLVDGAVAASSAPITVDYAGRYVLTSLDGKATSALRLLENGLPREVQVRTSAFSIPGRSRPVVMYDIPGGQSGEWVAQTAGAGTDDLRALVDTGAPLLIRTDGTVRDLDPAEFVHLTSASHAATWASLAGGTARNWSLGYLVIDDPQPATLIPTSTWADFDRAYTGLTWAAFDAEWTGSTWDQFDLEDWSTR